MVEFLSYALNILHFRGPVTVHPKLLPGIAFAVEAQLDKVNDKNQIPPVVLLLFHNSGQDENICYYARRGLYRAFISN